MFGSKDMWQDGKNRWSSLKYKIKEGRSGRIWIRAGQNVEKERLLSDGRHCEAGRGVWKKVESGRKEKIDK
jgi:hypothetical protein